MESNVDAKISQALRDIPGILRAVSAVIPLAPGGEIEGSALVVHCLFEKTPASQLAELITWLRQKAFAIMAILQSQQISLEVSIIGITIRLKERGENNIIYACDVLANKLLRQRSNVPIEISTAMLHTEFSHDPEINALLSV